MLLTKTLSKFNVVSCEEKTKMSITKVGKAKSSADAIDYVLKEEKKGDKQPKVIGGNVAGSTSQEIKDEFREQEKLNFKVKNTVIHISVSFPTGRHISNQIANDYADQLVVELGFEMNPYLVVRHFDKDNRSEESYSHIHIVASRINNDGTLISEWQIAERTIAATIEIDKNFGLKSVEYKKTNQGEKNERNIKNNEYRVMQKTGNLSVLEEFKDAAEEALRQINEVETETKGAYIELNKTQNFIEKLQKKGFEVLPHIAKDGGQMKGFSFKKDKIIFTASKAGKKFGWTNLSAQLEYDAEKDLKFLVNLKDEVLVEFDKTTLPIDGKPDSHSGKNLRVKFSNEEFSEPQEIQSKIETKIENVLDANELFEVGDNKQTQYSVKQVEIANQSTELKKNENQNQLKANQNELQEEQNEKTSKLTSDKSTIELRETINGEIEKEESNSAKQIKKLAEKIGNESNSCLEKIEIIREESAKIRSDRTSHEGTGSREINSGDKNATKAANIDDTRENRTDEERIDDGRFSYSEANQHGKAAFERNEFKYSSIKKSTDRISESNGNINHESTKGETKLSEFHETSREIESGISSTRKFERHIDFGDSDEEKQTNESGKFEPESSSFATAAKNNGDEISNKFIPESIEGSENSSQEKRKEISELGEPGSKISVRRYSTVVDNSGDNNVSADERKFESEFGNFSEKTRRIGENNGKDLLPKSESETTISGGQEVLSTHGRTAAENYSIHRRTNRQTAEITTQIINIQFFSGQLNKKIVEKWTDLIESSNAKEFLSKVIMPENKDVKAFLFEHINRQSLIIAENLRLPKPEIMEKADTKQLAIVLTKIVVNNFEEATKIKVNDRTIERLAKENEPLAKVPTTDELIPQIKENTGEIPFQQIFANSLEIAAFNSLLNPKSVDFDKDYIIKTQEEVIVDEVSAYKTVNLIQIAYGGQCDKFTNEFKSDLADQIYNQPATAAEIYNNYKEFDWQKTVQTFAPMVNIVAEQYGITIQRPNNEAEKNKMLADNFSQQIIKSFEALNKPVEFYVKDELLKRAELAGNTQLKSIQNGNTITIDNQLESPNFHNSLDTIFYNFNKSSETEKSEKSEKIVEKIREAEEAKLEKQKQAEIKMLFEGEVLSR